MAEMLGVDAGAAPMDGPGVTHERVEKPVVAPSPGERAGAWRALLVLLGSGAIALVCGAVAVEVRLALDGDVPERRAAARLARVAMVAGFAGGYALLGRRRGVPFLRRAGLVPAVAPVSHYVAGWVAGVVPVILLVVLLVGIGARTVEVRREPLELLGIAAKLVAFGLVLALIEEAVFRGLLLWDLTRSLGTVAGVTAASVIFSTTHFLGVSRAWRDSPESVEGGADTVLALLAGMGRMIEDWPALVGLTLVGAILAALRVRTGAIYLSMGVHAGWYWAKQSDRYFVDETAELAANPSLWIGTEQYHDGVLGWACLLVTLALAMVVRMPAKRSIET
jgi:membrane protease YdiL (CAAX protease family)